MAHLPTIPYSQRSYTVRELQAFGRRGHSHGSTDELLGASIELIRFHLLGHKFDWQFRDWQPPSFPYHRVAEHIDRADHFSGSSVNPQTQPDMHVQLIKGS